MVPHWDQIKLLRAANKVSTISGKISPTIIDKVKTSSTISFRPTTPSKPTSTLAKIVRAPFQHPLISHNKFTPLHYQNVLITPRDLSRTNIPINQSSSSSQEYIEKLGHISIITLEKDWITTNTNTIPSKIFLPDFHYVHTDPTKTSTFQQTLILQKSDIPKILRVIFNSPNRKS